MSYKVNLDFELIVALSFLVSTHTISPSLYVNKISRQDVLCLVVLFPQAKLLEND